MAQAMEKGKAPWNFQNQIQRKAKQRTWEV